jgi:hypothetical protein
MLRKKSETYLFWLKFIIHFKLLIKRKETNLPKQKKGISVVVKQGDQNSNDNTTVRTTTKEYLLLHYLIKKEGRNKHEERLNESMSSFLHIFHCFGNKIKTVFIIIIIITSFIISSSG